MSDPKLGEWTVERISDTQVILRLPEGMIVTGQDVTIEDVLHAISTHSAIKAGRPVVKCCGGSTAIA